MVAVMYPAMVWKHTDTGENLPINRIMNGIIIARNGFLLFLFFLLFTYPQNHRLVACVSCCCFCFFFCTVLMQNTTTRVQAAAAVQNIKKMRQGREYRYIAIGGIVNVL